MLEVNEVFSSIQGEGTMVGTPMTFIRLQGCNLKCAWCDTKYAQTKGASEASQMSIAEIVSRVVDSWVCITGGEPLMQSDGVLGLIMALKAHEYSIEIETNGSLPPPVWAFWNIVDDQDEEIPIVDSWVVDVKLPSAGVGDDFSLTTHKLWWGSLRWHDQIKFVAANSEDLGVVLELLECLDYPQGTILVSPMLNTEGTNEPGWAIKVAEFCMENTLRYSLQIHKLLWGNKRGV